MTSHLFFFWNNTAYTMKPGVTLTIFLYIYQHTHVVQKRQISSYCIFSFETFTQLCFNVGPASQVKSTLCDCLVFLLGVHLSVPFGMYSLFMLQDLVSRRIHIKTACDVPVTTLTTYISPSVTKRCSNVVSTPWRRRGR